MTKSGRPVKLLPLLLILILSGIVFYNSLGNSFHFDDSHHIVDNPYLKSLKDIPELFTDTRTFSVWEGNNRHYRPLLMLTYSINYAIGGLNPFGYHIVNLAFHVGSAFLIFLIVQAIHTPPLLKGVQGGFFIALAAALIFAVHPFNSEVVNYISTRSSVMSAFFFLLAFYCWVRFRSQKVSSYFLLLTSYFYIASLLAFLLGMLTKEVVITLPIVLWLYDFYFVPVSCNNKRSAVVEHIKRLTVYLPFWLFVAIPYVLIRGVLVQRSGGVAFTVLPRSYYENLLMESSVLLKYIYLWLVPSNLSVEHKVWRVPSIADGYTVLSIVVIAGLLVFALWLYRRSERRYAVVSFFILWYFIILSPLMVIPLNTVLQENRAYLAGIFFAVTAGILIWYFARMFSGLHLWAGISVLIVILFFCSAMTIARNKVWKDDLSLWTDAVRKSPSSARAHHFLALTYSKAGKVDTAIAEYEKALELEEGYSRAEIHNNLGSLYGNQRLWNLATQEFKTAIEINPRFYKAYNNLGTIYMVKGDMDEAARKFKEALYIYPGYTKARMNLEKVYERDKSDKQ